MIQPGGLVGGEIRGSSAGLRKKGRIQAIDAKSIPQVLKPSLI
jgi:hypothetical protein